MDLVPSRGRLKDPGQLVGPVRDSVGAILRGGVFEHVSPGSELLGREFDPWIITLSHGEADGGGVTRAPGKPRSEGSHVTHFLHHGG